MGNQYSQHYLYPQDELYPPTPPPLPPFPPPDDAASSFPTRVPRNLFVYWDNRGEAEGLPEFVAACIASMRRLNPDWTAHLIDPDSAITRWGLEPPPVPFGGKSLGKAALGDWFRLEALHKYGGVYLDATMIQLRSLEHWVNASSSAVQGYSMPEGWYPNEPLTMESFAIAAPLNSTFLQRWQGHLGEAFRVGTHAWARQLQRPDLVGSLCEPSEEGAPAPQLGTCFFAIHLAWRLTRDELAADAHPTALVSSTSIGRPFHYLIQADENSKKAVHRVLTAPTTMLTHTDSVKFRSNERNCMKPLSEYFDEDEENEATKPANIAAWLRKSLEDQPDLLAAVRAPANETREGECEEPDTWEAFVIAVVCMSACTPVLVCIIILLEKRRRLRFADMDTEATALGGSAGQQPNSRATESTTLLASGSAEESSRRKA